jgi:hypothetical protein
MSLIKKRPDGISNRTSMKTLNRFIMTSAKFRMKLAALLTGFLCALALPALAVTPKLASVGQVGPSAGAGNHYALLLWQPLDGYAPGPAHAVYRKAGLATSTNEFALLAIVQPTADEPTLAALLQISAQAGFNVVELESIIDSLAGGTAPGGSLAAKLSWAVAGNLPPAAQQFFQDVVLRQMPPAAIAAGRGYLATVNASEASTFEIREYDLVTKMSGQVLGRVTTGTAAGALPAPGELTERVDTSPKGNLRVQLRWCSPQMLRARMLHVSGFNVYRANRTAWQAARGAPPPLNLMPVEMSQALLDGLLVQVNRKPVSPELDLTCGVPVDSEQFFIADDNDTTQLKAHEPGGAPFVAGSQYTYYAAALDHFRRPGLPSPGLEVVVCDRMPPQVPKRLAVDNVYNFDDAVGNTLQSLSVSWLRNDPAEVSHYWIYRWNSPAEALANAGAPNIANLLARIPNTGTNNRLEFVDNGTMQLPAAPPPPSLPADAGKTFWYTVRAEDDTPCKTPAGVGNLSGPSAPAYGVLRDWIGPTNSSRGLTTRCCTVQGQFSAETATLSQGHIRLRAVQGSPRVAWVEFRETGGALPVSRFEFSALVKVIETTVNFAGGKAQFEARFGTAAGAVSAWQPGLNLNNPTAIPLHIWTAAVSCSTQQWPCSPNFSDPVDPDTGDITGVCGQIVQTPSSVEWRVYRRVNSGGTIIQISSGRFPESDWCDTSVPGAPATLCYFAQLFDQDGNPSVIVRLGCVESLGTENLPKPVMTRAEVPPVAGQAPAVVQSALEWFCPRPGVERFEIAIVPPPPGSAQVVWLPVPGAEEAIGQNYGIYPSPRLPAGFGGNGSEFAHSIPVLRGVNYRARVRAIRTSAAPDGSPIEASGQWSDEMPLTLTVQSSEPTGPQVPWPARPVPAINPNAMAFAEYDTQEEIGRIEIGVIPLSVPVTASGTVTIVGGESLQPYLTVPPPFVIYRHDASTGGRAEMTQITHYITDFLATTVGTPPNESLQITDRLLLVKRRNGEPAGPFRLWIRDTQPVIGGRDYRYSVVRHGEDREIVEVRASNNASVPE